MIEFHEITEDLELWFALIVGKDHPLREINHQYRIADNTDDDTAVFEPCQIIELLSRDLMEELPSGLVRTSSKGIGLLHEWQRFSELEIIEYVSPMTAAAAKCPWCRWCSFDAWIDHSTDFAAAEDFRQHLSAPRAAHNLSLKDQDRRQRGNQHRHHQKGDRGNSHRLQEGHHHCEEDRPRHE
jgi:hypothetical protein